MAITPRRVSNWNFANFLTFSRFPGMCAVWWLYAEAHVFAAVVVFSLVCITDYYDGKVSRWYGLQTPLGNFLDPIADKWVTVLMIILLWPLVTQSGSVILATVIILAREVIVTVERLPSMIATFRSGIIPPDDPLKVNRMAKWKTGFQMVSLGVFLAVGEPSLEWLSNQVLWLLHEKSLLNVGETLYIIAGTLTVITGLDYMSGFRISKELGGVRDMVLAPLRQLFRK